MGLGGPLQVAAAPYAAMVMDARNGKVLHSRNADTRLHPASLTKMMTLYIAFEAVRRGEISLDTKVRISKNAAAEPASKLWLKAGSRVKLRYLIRAAAVKSANDAATAIAEGISGSEEAFARRMNRTARALGMRNTNFKNAHGLTQKGHYSSARDMTILGRHLIYDYPQYYNLFSRRTANANGTEVANTNRRLLKAYRGADGIKTGYTRAAGFNLVASAERGRERIIATMFGGTSGAARNARVAELLDMGFKRAPSRVSVRKPALPRYADLPEKAPAAATADRPKTSARQVASSPRPLRRPVQVADAEAPAPVQNSETGGLGSIIPKARAAQVAAASTAAIAQVQEDLSGDAQAQLGSALPQEAINAQIATALIEESAPEATEPDADLALNAPELAPSEPIEDSRLALAEIAPTQQANLETPAWPMPSQRPAKVTYSVMASAETDVATALPVSASNPAPKPTIVPRVSGSGGRQWGISVGTYASRYEAERVLLKTALIEVETLNDALRRVTAGNRGFEASFVGLSERSAALACQRLTARAHDCTPIGP
ncbi:MAG: serine hydrolase [Mangrovicoccus sp.]|nr:serine hydrolase [Mangrovicoccus sp.]